MLTSLLPRLFFVATSHSCACTPSVSHGVSSLLLSVAADVSAWAGVTVHRIRLHEQMEEGGGVQGLVVDEDLLQYYRFLADKGDTQAQVSILFL